MRTSLSGVSHTGVYWPDNHGTSPDTFDSTSGALVSNGGQYPISSIDTPFHVPSQAQQYRTKMLFAGDKRDRRRVAMHGKSL